MYYCWISRSFAASRRAFLILFFCTLFFALSLNQMNAWKRLGYCVLCVSFETSIVCQFPMKLQTDLLSVVIPPRGEYSHYIVFLMWSLDWVATLYYSILECENPRLHYCFFLILMYSFNYNKSPAQLFAKFCLIDATGAFPLALIVILEHFRFSISSYFYQFTMSVDCRK